MTQDETLVRRIVNAVIEAPTAAQGDAAVRELLASPVPCAVCLQRQAEGKWFNHDQVAYMTAANARAEAAESRLQVVEQERDTLKAAISPATNRTIAELALLAAGHREDSDEADEREAKLEAALSRLSVLTEELAEAKSMIVDLRAARDRFESSSIAGWDEADHQRGHKEDYIKFMAEAESSLTALRLGITALEQEMREAIGSSACVLDVCLEDWADRLRVLLAGSPQTEETTKKADTRAGRPPS